MIYKRNQDSEVHPLKENNNKFIGELLKVSITSVSVGGKEALNRSRAMLKFT